MQREKVTVSVFILSGSQLKATYSLEGPIADLGVDSGLELYTNANAFSSSGGRNNKRALSVSREVDFEHLNEIDDDDDDDDDDDNTDDEYSKPIDKDDPGADKKRRERREHQRQKFLELKKKREGKKLAQLKKVRQDGEPILYTTKAPESGWYRMCVTSNWNQVSAYKYAYIFITSYRPLGNLKIDYVTFYFKPCQFRLLLKWK